MLSRYVTLPALAPRPHDGAGPLALTSHHRQPFLALTKSASSPRAAADLVTRATSAPGTYVFTELLQTPQIQSLSESPEYSSHYTLLQIFSYGTYADYTSTAGLPALQEQQVVKLRQLSLLTLAKDPRNLTYAALQSSLALPDTRAVENLIVSAVYADLITAQLDPHNQTVHVSSISPLRDLAPNSIPTMLATLQDWSSRCTSTLAHLEAQIAAIEATSHKRHTEKKAWAAKTDVLVEEAKNSDKGAHGRDQPNMISRAVANFRGGHPYKKRDRGGSGTEASPYEEEAMDLDLDENVEAEGSSSAGRGRASRRKL